MNVVIVGKVTESVVMLVDDLEPVSGGRAYSKAEAEVIEATLWSNELLICGAPTPSYVTNGFVKQRDIADGL